MLSTHLLLNCILSIFMGDFHSSPKKYICFSFDLLPRIRITKSTTYAISENHINKISKFLSNITNKRSIFTIYIKKERRKEIMDHSVSISF